MEAWWVLKEDLEAGQKMVVESGCSMACEISRARGSCTFLSSSSPEHQHYQMTGEHARLSADIYPSLHPTHHSTIFSRPSERPLEDPTVYNYLTDPSKEASLLPPFSLTLTLLAAGLLLRLLVLLVLAGDATPDTAREATNSLSPSSVLRPTRWPSSGFTYLPDTTHSGPHATDDIALPELANAIPDSAGDAGYRVSDTLPDSRHGASNSLVRDVPSNAVACALDGIAGILAGVADGVANSSCGTRGNSGNITFAQGPSGVADSLAEALRRSRGGLAHVACGVCLNVKMDI